MPAEPLSACEREEIRAGIERAEPDGVIADRLGRHRTAVNREISRNGGRARYSATAAQAGAGGQRSRPKVAKLARDPRLAVHVATRLAAKDSPMTSSLELGGDVHGLTVPVSHECIYQAVYVHGTRGLPKGLHAGLHRRRRCRKHRHPNGAAPAAPSPLGEFNFTCDRPAIAAERAEGGHLEGDLIIGAHNRSAIATVFDRASRYLWLTDMPEGYDADATLAALARIFHRAG